MKYLGIDFGEKNVGLALSDELLTMAFPLSVLENTPNLVEEIGKICKEKEVGLIVVGESKNYAGDENEVMKKIKPFVSELEEKLKIKVVMHPEFLTSIEAERLQGKNDMHDASAAALILKSYLESQNSNQSTI